MQQKMFGNGNVGHEKPPYTGYESVCAAEAAHTAWLLSKTTWDRRDWGARPAAGPDVWALKALRLPALPQARQRVLQQALPSLPGQQQAFRKLRAWRQPEPRGQPFLLLEPYRQRTQPELPGQRYPLRPTRLPAWQRHEDQRDWACAPAARVQSLQAVRAP